MVAKSLNIVRSHLAVRLTPQWGVLIGGSPAGPRESLVTANRPLQTSAPESVAPIFVGMIVRNFDTPASSNLNDTLARVIVMQLISLSRLELPVHSFSPLNWRFALLDPWWSLSSDRALHFVQIRLRCKCVKKKSFRIRILSRVAHLKLIATSIVFRLLRIGHVLWLALFSD